jgi:phage shock protein PspC (stress-responsive transcriptional regulator)
MCPAGLNPHDDGMEAQHQPPTSSGRTLPPPPPWRLLRARDGVLGGVCAGISRATGVDLTLVRLAAIAFGLTGIGVLVYLVLWIVVPVEDPAAGRVLAPAPADPAKWLKIGVLVAAALGIATLLGSAWPFGWQRGDAGPGLLLGVILVAVGIAYLVSRRTGEQGEARPLPPPSGPPVGAMPVGGPFATDAAVPGADTLVIDRVPTPATPMAPVSAARTSTGSSAGVVVLKIFAWLTIIFLLLGAAVVAGLVSVGALSMQWPWLVGLVAFAAFLGLVVMAVTARTAAPILVAFVFVIGAGFFGAAMSNLVGGVGDRVVTVRAPDELADRYELAMGRRVLDLTALPATEGNRTVRIEHGMGQVDVIVPSDASVSVSARAGIGEVQVLGQTESGVGADVTVTGGPEGPIDLDIDARVGIGQVRVCWPTPGTGGNLGCG